MKNAQDIFTIANADSNFVFKRKEGTNAYLLRCMSCNEYHADFEYVYFEMTEQLRGKMHSMLYAFEAALSAYPKINAIDTFDYSFYAIKSTANVTSEDQDTLEETSLIEVENVDDDTLDIIAGRTDNGSKLHLSSRGFYWSLFAKHSDIAHFTDIFNFRF